MKNLQYRDLVKILKNHDPGFSISKDRGRGSHRMSVHTDVDGGITPYPVPYHGEKKQIPHRMQKLIIHHFNLPESIFDSK